MRQMADRGKDAVVHFRRQFVYIGTTQRPGALDVVEGIVAVFGQWRDDDLLALIEIPAGRRRAAIFGAGNRVSRDELADTVAQCSPRRSDDVALGRTAVGDDGMRAKIRSDAFENIGHLGHRRRHQNDVSILDFVGRVDAGPVDHAQFLRLA